jgi:hypothetical protein
MKKEIKNPEYWLTRILVPAIFCILFIAPAAGQKTGKTDFLSSGKLPAGLKLLEKGAYRYEMVADYFNHDILGNFQNKTEVKGIYTRGLDGGKVSWNNVTIAQSASKDQAFPAGEKQDYMEGFTYDPASDMMKESSFPGFPAATGVFGKNLVWDAMSFEVFAWIYYDSLVLNTPYEARQFNSELNLEGLGTFENKNIILTWTGISKMNGKPCAVIEFNAMDNPINFKSDFFEMKGRSNYWGTIWMSLTDKQIERGVLYEDVNMEMKMGGQDKSQLLNTSRKIDFDKLQ